VPSLPKTVGCQRINIKEKTKWLPHIFLAEQLIPMGAGIAALAVICIFEKPLACS